MLPLNLVFIRHGESEGNRANWASEEGDHSLFTPEHMERHSSSWRLTDRGIWQARQTGEWLSSHHLASFDRYYTSEYLRCLETAAHLGLHDARWLTDFNLRERDYGLMDVATDEEKKTRFAAHHREFHKHRFYATLPSGETMARLCARLGATIFTDLHTYGSHDPASSAILVTHGGVMRAVAMMLERGNGYDYHEREVAGGKRDRVANCQIHHYTRVNPNCPMEVLPHVGWVRSVCAWDESRSSHWRRIEFKKYSNSDLLAFVERQPRIINQ